jgi:hypothetical protein
LGAEQCVRGRQQRAISAANRRARADPIVLNLLELWIVATGELDGLFDGKGLARRIARNNLGGCLNGACHETYEKQ